MEAAEKDYNTHLDSAVRRFTEFEKLGFTMGQNFYAWIAEGNAPEFSVA